MKRVFLIDDDDVFVFLTKKVIERSGADVVLSVFSNGQEGIEYIKEIAADPDLLPDVILLDLNMPVMDGWEFLNAYQELELAKDIALYIVTSSISPYEVERAKHIKEVQEFIVKPIAKEKFIDIIAN
ncbi:MAG: Receiver protein of a two-component response regulator [Pedobacter sp.]|jgi:CheY-like chemotaxis protein|nr:Receiver protein of a two-component response regulator [Pedobacter sp.]